MKLKSTGDIFHLIFKLLYYFIIDRTYFKKLILHSGRELWYLITIFILSAMIASLIAQLTIIKLKPPEQIKCLDVKNDLVVSPQIVYQCNENDPTPSKPKQPVIALPPKTNDRKEHNLELLLDKIR